MTQPSKSLTDFRNSLKLADSLQKNGNKYGEIPRQEYENFVYGSRGGSIVLMVAAFENFLEELVIEKIDYLKRHQNFDPDKLPAELIFHNCSNIIKNSPKNTASLKIIHEKINVYYSVAERVVKTDIDPQLFSLLADGNPNPEKVERLFYCLGISNIFKKLQPKFDKKWQKFDPRTAIDIYTELDTLVQRRHAVAHKASAMGIAGEDVIRYLKFLKIFAKLIDDELLLHFEKMVK